MLFYYKNSFLASIVSLLGCGLLIVGIQEATSYGIVYGIPWIAGSIPFLVLAKIISSQKAFKKWWKQVEKANLVPEIAKSTQTALDIYSKNPQNRTLKKIAVLNPEAAAIIERNRNAQKK